LATSTKNGTIHKKIDLYLSNLNFKKQTIMEEKSASIWKSTMLSGVYLAIAMILLSVIFYVTGNTFSKTAQYLSYPIIIAGIIWGQISYKKELGGIMPYGQALLAGLLTMVFASVISSIYTYILYSIIDPSLQEQLRIFTEEQMIAQGNVPEAQMEAAMKITSKLQTPIMMLVMGIFGGAFIGVIVSLITAIFIKKNPSDEVPE
jgi:hypothetical protein